MNEVYSNGHWTNITTSKHSQWLCLTPPYPRFSFAIMFLVYALLLHLTDSTPVQQCEPEEKNEPGYDRSRSVLYLCHSYDNAFYLRRKLDFERFRKARNQLRNSWMLMRVRANLPNLVRKQINQRRRPPRTP